MKGYLIKVTYLDGIHKGETYLMKKGGYIAKEPDCGYYCDSEVYKTIGTVKSVCTRLYNNNELNRRIEDRDNEYRKEKYGREPNDWHIYEHESYEPYEVEYAKFSF